MLKIGNRIPALLPVLLVIAGLLTGCSSDQRLVEMAQQSLERQADQNHEMARQNEAVNKATRQLLEAEASARQEAGRLHSELGQERRALDTQREVLEDERRSLAAARVREPIIAEAIKAVVVLVIAAMPLLVCCQLVHSLFGHTDQLAADALIDQLMALDGPLLARLENSSAQDQSARVDQLTDLRSPRLPFSSGSQRPDEQNDQLSG